MGGKGSGRKPNITQARPIITRFCLYCGSPITGSRHYCNNAHKQAAYRRRQKADQEQPAAVREA